MSKIKTTFLLAIIFFKLFSMETEPEDVSYASNNGPDSLFNIVAKSPAIKDILKNIAKKPVGERKKFLNKLTDAAQAKLKEIAIDVFLPELDEHFKNKPILKNKIESEDVFNILKFDNSGNYIITAGISRKNPNCKYFIKIFSVHENSNEIASCSIDNEIVFCDFLEDNSKIIISTLISIFLFNINSKKLIKLYDYPSILSNLISGNFPPIKLSSDRKRLAVFCEGDYDNPQKKLIVFNLQTQQACIQDVEDRYTQLEFGKNNLIILTSARGNILVYDIENMQKVATQNIRLSNYSSNIKYAHLVLNDKYILVSDGCAIYLLNYSSNDRYMFKKIPIYNQGSLLNYYTEAGNKLLAFACISTGKIYSVRLDNLDLKNPLKAETIEEELNCNKDHLKTLVEIAGLKGESLGFREIRISPDEKYLINITSSRINIINIESQKNMASFERLLRWAYCEVWFSPNSEYFAYSCYGNKGWRFLIYKTPKGMAQDLSFEEILNIASRDINRSKCEII